MQKIKYSLFNFYRLLFSRPSFYSLNRFLYRCSLSGMGIMNFESDAISGESNFLNKVLKGQKGVVVDVGANVGRYSAQVLDISDGIEVYAFEPHPINFKELCEAVNSERFHPYNCAVGESDGELQLFDYDSAKGSSHASLYKDVIEGIHGHSAVSLSVQVYSLGEFLSSAGIDRVQLLKIDTEGNELSVLKGVESYIASKKIDVIHFEFNEMNVSSRVFFRDFWKILQGYDVYRLLPRGMVKIDRYNPLYCEIFAYQNIVAFAQR